MMRLVVVAAVALLAPPVFAAECKPVSEYKVSHISYRARPMEQTLHRMLRGTPYRGIVQGGVKTPIRTRRIAGPFSLTLDLLAEQAGMNWRQEGCLLRITEKQASMTTLVPQFTQIAAAPVVVPAMAQQSAVQPAATSWLLQADLPIHKQFADWAHIAGWKFEWRLEKSWLVPAATQFTGSFDQALSEAVISLHAQGKPVRLIIWEGNRFAEIVDVDAK